MLLPFSGLSGVPCASGRRPNDGGLQVHIPIHKPLVLLLGLGALVELLDSGVVEHEAHDVGRGRIAFITMCVHVGPRSFPPVVPMVGLLLPAHQLRVFLEVVQVGLVPLLFQASLHAGCGGRRRRFQGGQLPGLPLLTRLVVCAQVLWQLEVHADLVLGVPARNDNLDCAKADTPCKASIS